MRESLNQKIKFIALNVTSMNKDLAEKAIDIKGKKYVLVSDRILYFNEVYPNGSIKTDFISDPERVIIKVTVTPDNDKPERFFTGHSQAVWGDSYINKTSALENAETSAVGRGLAMMGIGVIDSVASVDEIHKAESTLEENKSRTGQDFTPSTKPIDQPQAQNHLTIKNPNDPASQKQIEMIHSLAKQKGKKLTPQERISIAQYTKGEASKKINVLLKLKSPTLPDLQGEAKKVFPIKEEIDEVEIVDPNEPPF